MSRGDIPSWPDANPMGTPRAVTAWFAPRATARFTRAWFRPARVALSRRLRIRGPFHDLQEAGVVVVLAVLLVFQVVRAALWLAVVAALWAAQLAWLPPWLILTAVRRVTGP